MEGWESSWRNVFSCSWPTCWRTGMGPTNCSLNSSLERAEPPMGLVLSPENLLSTENLYPCRLHWRTVEIQSHKTAAESWMASHLRSTVSSDANLWQPSAFWNVGWNAKYYGLPTTQSSLFAETTPRLDFYPVYLRLFIFK